MNSIVNGKMITVTVLVQSQEDYVGFNCESGSLCDILSTMFCMRLILNDFGAYKCIYIVYVVVIKICVYFVRFHDSVVNHDVSEGWIVRTSTVFDYLELVYVFHEVKLIYLFIAVLIPVILHLEVNTSRKYEICLKSKIHHQRISKWVNTTSFCDQCYVCIRIPVSYLH